MDFQENSPDNEPDKIEKIGQTSKSPDDTTDTHRFIFTLLREKFERTKEKAKSERRSVREVLNSLVDEYLDGTAGKINENLAELTAQQQRLILEQTRALAKVSELLEMAAEQKLQLVKRLRVTKLKLSALEERSRNFERRVLDVERFSSDDMVCLLKERLDEVKDYCAEQIRCYQFALSVVSAEERKKAIRAYLDAQLKAGDRRLDMEIDARGMNFEDAYEEDSDNSTTKENQD